MRFSYHSEQWLPHPPELVFAFFANPENRPRLMHRWQRARIEQAAVAPPPPPPTPQTAAGKPRQSLTSFATGPGTRLTLSLRPFPYSPLRVAWEAEIVEFVWNSRLCYRQVRGPFAYWNHCHTVEPQPRSASDEAMSGAMNGTKDGTLLRHEVEYELPFGAFGQLAQKLVERRLQTTFEFRHRRTSEYLALMALANSRLSLS